MARTSSGPLAHMRDMHSQPSYTHPFCTDLAHRLNCNCPGPVFTTVPQG